MCFVSRDQVCRWRNTNLCTFGSEGRRLIYQSSSDPLAVPGMGYCFDLLVFFLSGPSWQVSLYGQWLLPLGWTGHFFFLFFLSFLFVCPFLEYMLASLLQILLILFSLVSVFHGLQ